MSHIDFSTMIFRFTLPFAFALLVSGCGSTPTLLGEGFRGAIDSTEDKKPSSDPKVIYFESTKRQQ
jgi:hypothetical protein